MRRELWFLDSMDVEHHITSLSWEIRETPTSPWQSKQMTPHTLGLIEKIFIEKERQRSSTWEHENRGVV